MKFNQLIMILLAVCLTSCASTTKRSFAGGQRDVIPVEKQELLKRMEWEVKAMPRAIKICDKRKGKVRVLNPSQNIEQSENYSKMRMVCNVTQKSKKIL